MRKGITYAFSCFVVMFVVLLIAKGFDNAITVMSGSNKDDRSTCIIIDAGHGSPDGGAISCSGKPESEYNLEISLRLNDLLRFLGYHTKMVRTSNDSIYTSGNSIAQKKVSDLKERVKLANNTPGALLISIHQNTFPEQQYHGAQVFYGSSQRSDDLAKQIQDNLIYAINPESKRNAKRGQGIYLLDRSKCTSVLVECGFISNIEEEANLRKPDYQKNLCAVIAASVSTFLSNT